MNTKEAVDTLRKALLADPDYRFAWQSNIAVAFVDAYNHHLKREVGVHSDVNLYEAANDGASRFLTSLCLPDPEPAATSTGTSESGAIPTPNDPESSEIESLRTRLAEAERIIRRGYNSRSVNRKYDTDLEGLMDEFCTLAEEYRTRYPVALTEESKK